jgi:LPS-assembly protein
MTQDLQNQRLEYRDSYLDVFGVPVLYLPYFSMSDPSVRRQSGFLVPSLGLTDEYLGSFLKIPYFWVIDGQQDVTFTPEFATKQGPQMEVTYRRAFNNGTLRLDGAIAEDEHTLAGYFFGHGLFNFNDTWRYGFDINLGSSVNYLRDFQIPGYGSSILASDLFIEGFGVGSYAKISVNTYQGLNSSIDQSLLPYVLPRYEYSYFGEPDALGGRLSFDTLAFNILRDVGSNDQELGGHLQWDRPLNGPLGTRWNFTAWTSGVVYNANVLDGQPNYASNDVSRGVSGQVQVALKMNWPFIRDAGRLGTQILEPIVQVIAAPQSGNSINNNIPNEDSLDYEFTDTTLFSLNRYNGYDRYDGGVRLNFGLRGEWDFAGGQKIEGLIGASYQQHLDGNLVPQFQPYNGFDLGAHLSDIVGRASFTPDSWFDITARARVDHRNGDIHFADVIASTGHPIFTLGGGFIYSVDDPYYLYLTNFNMPANNTVNNPFYKAYITPREEATLNASSHFGRWTVKGNARRDLQDGQMVAAGGDIQWENECVIADVSAYRRFTSINGDNGDTTVLFTIVLKTIGAVGVSG